jgi:competence protein ComEC
MAQSYDEAPTEAGHRVSPSVLATMSALMMWAATLVGEHVPRVGDVRRPLLLIGFIAVVSWYRTHRWRLKPWLFLVLVAVGAAGGSGAWNGTNRAIEGACSGEALVRTDPTWVGRGVGVVLELHSIRYRVIAHGIAGSRLAQRLAGETVLVRGQCGPTVGTYARYDRITHVLGRMNVEYVSEESSEGNGIIRAANRMRRALVDGVVSMQPELRALFTGLVIGDDRDQSREMIAEFRDSGLSHLCAVSGQNVAYLLAVLAPLLRRLRPGPRFIATIGIIAWFVILTRGEPSVLRAALMAGLVAMNAATRHSMNARTILACTVMILLVIDPMLAWSVGFALSVGATAGLAWCSARLQRIIGGRGIFASTLSAQIGTMPVSLLVFGYVPVVSLIANPLALTVAGAVMMVGLPCALFASMFDFVEPIVSAALTIPVRWVATVANVASAVSPKGLINFGLWVFVAWWVWRRLSRTDANHDCGKVEG